MPNLTTIEREFFKTDERVALLQGNLYRNHGDIELADGEKLYVEVNLNSVAKFSLEAVAWLGNFELSLYEMGTVNGSVPAPTPLNVNRVSSKVFDGSISVAQSTMGGSLDLTGAELLYKTVVDQKVSAEDGVTRAFPFILFNPDKHYIFVVDNTNNGLNSIQWDTQYTFTNV